MSKFNSVPTWLLPQMERPPRSGLLRVLPALFVFLCMLAPGVASAALQTYTICVKIDVELIDELDDTGSAYPNEIGFDGDWRARGIRVESMKYGIFNLSGFPKHADADTGCFTVDLDLSAPTDYTVTLKSWGIVGSNNELRTHNSGGVTSSYSKVITLNPASPSSSWTWGSSHLLRTYALFAYSIQEGFEGLYDDELLRVWWYGDSVDAEDTQCGCITCMIATSGVAHVCISEERSKRKFVVAHEYGHANVFLAISSSVQPNNCQKNSNTSHHMQAGYSEWNSCGAMEGWADFVAADIWNDNIHSGGSPNAYVRYWKRDYHVVSADTGTGGCASSSSDHDEDYVTAYADTCYTGVGWDSDSDCSTGDCNQTGNELDWMRTWWDYHTDTTSFSGGTVSHSQLHEDIKDALGWAYYNFWDEFRSAVYAASPSTRGPRLDEVGDYEGTSEP